MLNILFLLHILVTSVSSEQLEIAPSEPSMHEVYMETGLSGTLDYKIFSMAITGLQNIDTLKNRNLITIIDYSQASDKERFFVIDLLHRKLLYKTYVTHGKNTGKNIAVSFSNKLSSLQSSLGFFRTAETFYCNKGYSLSIDGLEPGINDNARKRSIIIHGAFYADPEFVREYGYTGLSWGCPSLPRKLAREIIDTIKGGTCLFIFGEDKDYPVNSKILHGNKNVEPLLH
jgi:hypothetical protein